MGLPKGSTKCIHCMSAEDVKLIGQRFRDGRCRVRCDCGRCGGFSHYLDLGTDVEAAIRRLVDETEAAAKGVTDTGPAPACATSPPPTAP